MRIISGAFAVVVLAGLGWSLPVQAQGMPQGSYLNSCTGAHVEGDTLVARCRGVDGRETRSALAGVHRCVGDIGNNNGALQCNFGGRAEGVPPREVGYGSERVDRCAGLHRESEELRGRIEHEFNPMERARMESHLHEIHEQEERCH